MHRPFCVLLIFLSLCCIPQNSSAEQILAVGDSIMLGVFGADPVPALGSYLGMTYHNSAVSGSCINGVDADISTWLSSYDPVRVYCNSGINDIRTYANSCHATMSNWLSYYASIRTKCNNASAALYALQITPECSEAYYPGNNPSGTIKTWNAYLEDWAYTNSVYMCPTYQDMSVNAPETSTSTDDCLANTLDGLHPTSTGDAIYSYLMSKADIPNRTRDWGSADYPSFGHESWSWWIITGTGSVTGGSTDGVTGKNDGGSLSLNSGASAVSNVLAIISDDNDITITPTLTQGAVTISYRTSSAYFARDAVSPSWTTYTGAFTDVNECTYIQVRIATSGETTAIADEITLDWTGYTPTPPPSLHRVNLNRVNMR